MSRIARIVVPGLPHHVTQRGNRKQDIFTADEDRNVYLHFLRKYSLRHGVDIWAYCLMRNHVHLIGVPKDEGSLATYLRDAHSTYALWFNEKEDTCGHLWQGRFYSCVLDERHLWAAVRYVERNPVRAGLVERATDYRWSSAAAHCGLRTDKLLSHTFPPRGVIDDWRDWLEQAESPREVEAVRRRTKSGRAFGSAGFVENLEVMLGRNLRPKKRGPKPKNANSGTEH